jgi:hypothetical protein
MSERQYIGNDSFEVQRRRRMSVSSSASRIRGVEWTVAPRAPRSSDLAMRCEDGTAAFAMPSRPECVPTDSDRLNTRYPFAKHKTTEASLGAVNSERNAFGELASLATPSPHTLDPAAEDAQS